MVRYLDDYERQCSRCKTGCAIEGMSGSIVCTGFTPMTNADRIRAMTDEELARFMWNRDIDIVEKACKATGFTYTVDMEKCFENVLNWLKQEVSE